MQVGDRVGDYEIVEVLGAGGMGKVYKVRHTISDRVEALKVLLPNLEGEPELADRFLREIKVQAALDHPNIAGLHTAQRVGNQLLMIMEYVEGSSVESMLRTGTVTLGKALDVISQVLGALAFAHTRGVIHRDIKPANIMVTPDGTVKLMDFGIARITAEPRLTQTGRTLGSLYYMSPEQIQGSTTLDARADLYSVGVTLYEMVTGKRPFEGESDYSVMVAHLQSTPAPPIQLDPTLPQMLNEVILMAIAKDPALRFQSAEAFRTALDSVRKSAGLLSSAAATATMAAASSRIRPGSNRRALYMVAGSLATILVLAILAIQVPKWRQARASGEPPPEPPAQSEPAKAEPVKAEPTEPAAPATPEPQAATPAPEPVAAPVTPAPSPTPLQAPPPRVPASAARPQTTPPRVTLPVSTPGAAAPAPTPSAAAPAQPPASAPATPVEDNRALLRELRERTMLLGVRVGAVKQSLATLQREQARSGLNLRSDITASAQRVDYYLDEAETAIKSGDAPTGKKYLDSAEREVEKLERFLGR